MEKEINSSSANAISNGWTFQYAAAMIIFLENMNKAQSFCVEGTDDIVVFLKDGKISAQAKCGLEQDSIVANHFTEIMESIRTLSSTENKDSLELISISNFHSPLGLDDSFAFTQPLDKKNFSNLTTISQNKIKSKCNELGYVIDFNKFKLWFFRFEGANPEIGVETFLDKKLESISIGSKFSTNDLMNQWLQIIQLNARDKKKIIETDIMCGTLFGKILAKTSMETIVRLIDEDVDPCYEEQFESFFAKYFSKNSQTFRIYNEIVSEFTNYVNNYKPSTRDKYKQFVDYYCRIKQIPEEICSLFNDMSHDEMSSLSRSLFRLFVAYVCFRKNIIDSIRKAFGYENN